MQILMQYFKCSVVPVIKIFSKLNRDFKTAVTLTKPSVGRRSVGVIGRQSADFVPDFNFFFSRPTKIKNN